MSRAVRLFAYLLMVLAGVATASVASAAPGPTFTKDVAPLMLSKCAQCHRPGEVAPMPLLSYEDVRPWAQAIKRQIVLKQMPPWFMDHDKSTLRFRNDRSLSQKQIDTIVAWVDSGAPKGDDKDMPPVPTFAEGWTFGEPDAIVELPVEVTIPAEGELDNQTYFVPVPWNEDRFVSKMEARPTNPAVTHHETIGMTKLPRGSSVGPDGKLVKAAATDVASLDPDAQTPGTRAAQANQDAFATEGERVSYKLLAWTPGKGYQQYRDGIGKRIKAGYHFSFSQHYQPTGRVEKDRSRLGLWFAQGPVQEAIQKRIGDTHLAKGQELVASSAHRYGALIPNIPPYEDNWQLMGVTAFKQPITLHALAPHMHLRGKDFKYIMVWPDGREETLLTVPKYDFNWQTFYDLETPLQVPAGAKIITVAHYDNSVKNEYNPSPEKEVYWSEQSWDEMFSGFYEYTIDGAKPTPTTTTRQQQNR